MFAKHTQHIPLTLTLTLTLLLALSIAFPLVGCAKKNEYKAPPPMPVTVAKPVHGEMVDSIETDGLVASTQLVEIRAQVEGLVTKIDFQDGEEVEEGDLLFEIDARQYLATQSEAEANVADLQARYSFSQSDFSRSKDLYAEDSISKQEYDQARQKMRALGAQVRAAQASHTGASVQLDFTKVRAPISGRISRRMVDRGQLVGAGEPTLLATIVASKDTYVEFSLSESELLRSRQYFSQNEGSREAFLANPIIRAGLRGDEGYPYEGLVDSLENMVSASTGTLGGRGIFVDAGRAFFPGLFCRVEIPLGTSEGLAVPEEVLMLDQVGRYVFVVDKEKRVQRRNVTLGGRKGALRRISKGLNPEDLVIIRGQARVRVGSHIVAKEETLKLEELAAKGGAKAKTVPDAEELKAKPGTEPAEPEAKGAAKSEATTSKNLAPTKAKAAKEKSK